jgi:protocatechuate 3,4-dioxygenase beta subunit
MVLSVIAMGAGGAAAANPISQTSDITVTNPAGSDVDVTISNLNDGVGAVNVTFSVAGNADATIEQVSLSPNPTLQQFAAGQGTDTASYRALYQNGGSVNQLDYTVTLGGPDAESATLEVTQTDIRDPNSEQYTLATEVLSGSISPDNADERSTTTHTLTFGVNNISADGNTDSLFVTLPAVASFDSVNSVSVTNSTGQPVSVTNTPSQDIDDVNQGTNNRVQIDVSPDGGDNVNAEVEVSFDASFGNVSGSVTAPVNAELQDSSGQTVSNDVADVTVNEIDGPQPNIVLESFDPDRGASAGDDVSVRFTLNNTGGAAGNASLDYELSNASGTVLTETFQVEDLGAGETQTFTRSISTEDLDQGNYTQSLTLGGTTLTQSLDLAGGNGFIRGTVRDENNNPIENATVVIRRSDNDRVVRNATTDDDGEYTAAVPALGSGTEYDVSVIQPGFESFQTEGVTLDQAGSVVNIDVVLVRIIQPANIDVNPKNPTAFTGETVTFTVSLTDENGNVSDAVENIQVDATEVTSSDVQFVGGTTKFTDENGEVTFNVTSDSVATATLNFTAPNEDLITGIETGVTFIQNGDGFVQGQVINDASTNPVEGASVYAVLDGRFNQNNFTNANGGPINVGALDDDNTIFVRLVDNETGQIIDNDDYRVQTTDAEDTGVRKIDSLNVTNESVGEGFAVVDLDGDGNVSFAHTRLEPEEYYAQVSLDASNTSEEALNGDNPENFATNVGDGVLTANVSTVQQSPFSPTANLTLAAAEERARASGANLVDSPGFENTFGRDTQGTNANGQYKLNRLFSNFQDGRAYVVIAQNEGFSTDFADVMVRGNGAGFENQYSTNFDLVPEAIEAAQVNVTQVGTRTMMNGTTVAFDNQSDEFAQNVSRDGTSIDVIEVQTRTEGGELINGSAIVEIEDDDTVAGPGNFTGEFVGAESGSFVQSGNDTVVVTTGDDGVATLLLRVDSNPSSLLTNKTATLTNDRSAEDRSAVRFVGVTDFQSASISGIVTDTDDTPLPDTAVYVRQFTYGPADENRVLIRPDDDGDTGADRVNEDTDEFVVTLQELDNTGDYQTVRTATVTAGELRNYTFPQSDFPDITVPRAGGAFTGFKLYTQTEDQVDASYTLDPVPAVDENISRTDYLVRGVKLEAPFRGRTGNAEAQVRPNFTDDANIVIPVQVAGADFVVSGLDAPSAAAQGSSITVEATVQNVGGAAASRNVEFRFDLNQDGFLSEGEVVSSQDVSLIPQGSERVSFTVTVPDGLDNGTYDHGVFALDADGNVDSQVTGTIEVNSSVETGSELNVTTLSAPSNATAGDVITVESTITNVGDGAADNEPVDFRLDLNGDGQLSASETLATQAVDLAPGASATVTYEIDTTGVSAGTYTHGVVTADDEGSAQITVMAANGGNGTSNVSVGGNAPATDVDGDGLLEDVNGDGSLGTGDVIVLFNNLDSDAVQDNSMMFDFNGDGSVGVGDVIVLFNSL